MSVESEYSSGAKELEVVEKTIKTTTKMIAYSNFEHKVNIVIPLYKNEITCPSYHLCNGFQPR